MQTSKRQTHRRRGWRIAAVLAVAGLGYYLVSHSLAATYASSAELETGSLAGVSTVQTDSAASAGKYVGFGTGLAAPTGLLGYTGGTSIAVRWNPATPKNSATVTQYNIFRNGSKVGSVNPATVNPMFPEANHCGYIDSAVSNGQTYSYQVQAQDSAGAVSGLSSPLSLTQPTSSQPIPSLSYDNGGNSDLDSYTNGTIIPFLKIWYPKMANLIAYPNYTATNSFKLVYDSSYTGVAYTSWARNDNNPRIVFSPVWMRKNLDQIASWLHESTHMIQNSTTYETNYSSWAVEGVADWAREYVLHDRNPKIPLVSDGGYQAGYSQGSYFLNWIQNNGNPGFIRKLTVAMNNGSFSNNFFSNTTGKTVDQQYSAMTSQFFGSNNAITGVGGKCLGTANNATAGLTNAQLMACGSSKWQPSYLVAGKDPASGFLLALNGGAPKTCLEMLYTGTTPGTQAIIYGCDVNSIGSHWKVGANNSLININSGLCLDTAGSGTAAGTNLVIQACNGSASQQWKF